MAIRRSPRSIPPFAGRIRRDRDRSPTSAGPATGLPTLVAARRRVFGAGNVEASSGAVDPSKVILSWFGVSSFAMAFHGTVVLLDAWIPRGLMSSQVPITVDQLTALEPEAIFIGHGHFDHAGDAAQIAAASGAVVVGTAQQCEHIAGQAAPGQILTRAVGDAADPPGTRHDVSVLGIEITAMSHIHSAVTRPDAGDPAPRVMVAPRWGSMLRHRPRREDTRHLLTHLKDPGGGTQLYQFRGGDTSITWHDSSGPIPEHAPELVEHLRALPPTTVQVGAIQGFNQYTNGLRDPRLYIEALRPRFFVPTHHDNWLPLVTTTGASYERPLAREVARLAPHDRPEVRFLRDPSDYLNPAPLTF